LDYSELLQRARTHLIFQIVKQPLLLSWRPSRNHKLIAGADIRPGFLREVAQENESSLTFLQLSPELSAFIPEFSMFVTKIPRCPEFVTELSKQYEKLYRQSVNSPDCGVADHLKVAIPSIYARQNTQ
jgi:hypothetical protein